MNLGPLEEEEQVLSTTEPSLQLGEAGFLTESLTIAGKLDSHGEGVFSGKT